MKVINKWYVWDQTLLEKLLLSVKVVARKKINFKEDNKVIENDSNTA